MLERTTRRALLATVGAAAVAGCSNEAPTRASSPTPESTPERTPTPDPGIVPPSRVFSPAARGADGYTLTAERWFALPSVRYRTDEGHATVEPFGDRFVGYDFRLGNDGEEPLDPLPDTEFTLRVAGETFEHVHALRGEVEFSRADQPPEEATIEPLRWYEPLAPGDDARLQLVFDVPAFPEFRHYLAWDHRVAVGGRAEPAYLHP